jgi:hypothetical protein
MKIQWTVGKQLSVLAIFLALPFSNAHAADPIFSGPQPGARTSPFKVTAIGESEPWKERDPIAENGAGPIVLIFIHNLERSLVPLLRVMDEYVALRTNELKSEIIFLSADKIAGEQRLKAASNSLRLKSKMGLSLDGIEGPGNYGLNKDCLMTIIMAKEKTVTANFALVQPGIADAPKVIAAMAKVSGDTNPPPVESLNRQQSGMGRRGDGAMAARNTNSNEKAGGPFPGAVPTDEKLVSLLRNFIRPTNDDARVDQVLKEAKEHIKDKPDLRKQAIDGWTRVLHFGDRYGTPYSRKVGSEFLEDLKKQ